MEALHPNRPLTNVLKALPEITIREIAADLANRLVNLSKVDSPEIQEALRLGPQSGGSLNTYEKMEAHVKQYERMYNRLYILSEKGKATEEEFLLAQLRLNAVTAAWALTNPDFLSAIDDVIYEFYSRPFHTAEENYDEIYRVVKSHSET